MNIREFMLRITIFALIVLAIIVIGMFALQ